MAAMEENKAKSDSLSVSMGRVMMSVAVIVTFGTVAASQSPEGSSAATVGTEAAASVPSPVWVNAVSSGAQATGGQTGAAGDMIGFSHSDGSGTQTITLVHTGKSWMAVYHIDRSGTIRLVSSRPVDADFSLQLNATSPLPKEIRRIGRR